MPRIVTALFQDHSQAHQALQALMEMGIAQSHITAIGFSEAREVSSISGFRSLTPSDDARAEIGGLDLPQSDLHLFERKLRQGCALIAARVDRDRLDEAVRVLEMFNPLDLDSETREAVGDRSSGADAGAPLGAGLTAGATAGMTNADALPGMGTLTNATDELGTADLGAGNTTATGDRRDTERADRPGVNELNAASAPPAPRSGPFQRHLNQGSRVRIYGRD
ncbi:hypothetical protein [Microvirga subterranea]|uniref:Heat induced stress protein YflT n=1 Tax=Microvirga subterranea TaxID=186651 RepID=A0A370HVQ8_9HYPH|nr:hypothetical protein [Microvirga subterranea]RDI62582.1 hypothetical protein DES45_101853 [Microvirga subterranea]